MQNSTFFTFLKVLFRLRIRIKYAFMFASGGLPHLSSNLGSYQGCLNNKVPTSEKCWDIILNENLIRKSQIPYTNN